MSNVAAARTVMSLAVDRKSSAGSSIGQAEAKLIKTALLGHDGKVDGDGMLELRTILANPKLSAPGRKELAPLEKKSSLSAAELGKLYAMNDAFEPTEGPKDGSKAFGPTKRGGLPQKVRSAIDDAKYEVEQYFAERAAGNDEYSSEKPKVFGIADKQGALLGYAVHGVGGWDTQTEGAVVFIGLDGKRLAMAEGEE